MAQREREIFSTAHHLLCQSNAPNFPSPPFPVTPAKAGTQGPIPHIAGVMAFPLAKILSVALDPRSGAGVTNKEMKMTKKNIKLSDGKITTQYLLFIIYLLNIGR